uniref:hypothetical protein n=1 Tax=Ilumatobacter sp. TaxID=1967498 RepID=UPI0026208D39
MIRVHLIAHHEHAGAHELAATTARWLRERGHEAWMPSSDAELFGLADLGGDAPASDADQVGQPEQLGVRARHPRLVAAFTQPSRRRGGQLVCPGMLVVG